MKEIVNCSKCGGIPIIRKERMSPRKNSGNKRKAPIHKFYVICEKCFVMGSWIPSSSDKAIADWNRKQKLILK